MKLNPHFKIVILEDSDFYNKLMTINIKAHVGKLALLKNFTFDILSYTRYNDCVRNFNPDTDIIITDYYLNECYNAEDVLDLIRKRGAKSKVIVISQIHNIETAICSILDGATEFILKDRKAMEKTRYVIEELITDKLSKTYMSPGLN